MPSDRLPDLDPFAVVDVDGWRAGGEEQLGTKPKQWLRDPSGQLWLWKAVTRNRSAAGEFLKGDDWSERIATEVARSLNVPVARTELAVRRGEIGTVSLSVVDMKAESLVLGNELLAEVGVEGDDPHDRAGYTLEAVRRALHGIAGPDLSAPAFDCFIGYLLLDAIVGNSDRHQENWAVIQNSEGHRRLAPSFDHASSLGFLLSDEDRSERLATPDFNQGPEAWAARARTRFEGRPSPAAIADEAMSHVEDNDAAEWTRLIERIDIAATIARVPAARMSAPARDFAVRVGEANRGRVLSQLARRMTS